MENPAIRYIFNLQAIWNFWPTRFIAHLSFALNYHFGRLNVFGYHLFNLLVHISASIMVWYFMLLTFSTPAMNGKKIAGGAQKRSEGVLLHHESILVPPGIDREVLTGAIRKRFERVFGVSIENADLDPDLYFRAAENSKTK